MFRKRTKSAEGEPLTDFVELCDVAFSDRLAAHGFVAVPGGFAHSGRAGSGAERSYRNGDRYVKVTATTDYRDGPQVNVEVGEGSLDWPEVDWNGVALWQLRGRVWPGRASPGSYPLGSIAGLPDVLAKAATDTEQHAADFLHGDLQRFRSARARVTRRRKPYQVGVPGASGRYEFTDDPESAELKRRFEDE